MTRYFLILYFLSLLNLTGTPTKAQPIKFTPISSRTESVLPKPSSELPYQGKYTSVTEVFAEQGKYFMVLNDLVGGWPCEKINVALLVSDDLTSWSWPAEPLLTSGDLKFPVSEPHGFVTSIIKIAGTYHAYMDVLDHDKNSGIGLATSRSLAGPWEIHPSFVLKPDPAGWDKYPIAGAEVVTVGDSLYMYYMAVMEDKLNGESSIGLAVSADGIKWKKKNGPVLSKSESGFDSFKVGVPKVIAEDTGFTMIYRTDNGDGTFGGDSAYGVAKSKNGLDWSRHQIDPVLSENDVENWFTVWACGFIKVDHTYHLFLEYDGPPVYDTRVNHAVYKLGE